MTIAAMYQNAPPPHGYNQGYQQSYGGGGGYYNDNQYQQQHPPSYNPYGAPSPVNAAYQRANAAMAGPSPSIQQQQQQNNAGGGATSTASGLIRLTLRKPMGIVFEPMTDPHNPSQQRGVRICDLPRTGAAAMSQKLEVGDELLSINDKTMSRLTFDEIMDFIIAADKERVDLLFRRPGKEKLKGEGASNAKHASGGPPPPGNVPVSPMGLSNSNSVKWIDEKSDMGGKLTEDVREPERDQYERGGRRGGGKPSQRQDDPSVDDTYNDGYTVESQSQYTMETYEEDRRRGGHRRGGADSRYSEEDENNNKSHRRNRNNRNDSRGKNDPVESSGFLDLLIDTLCTSVMGRDAREMCGDRSQRDKDKSVGGKNSRYDDDEDFTVDDETYATYEEQNDHRNAMGANRHHHRGHKVDEELMEDENTYTTAEDDGTQTLESKEVMNEMKQQQELPQKSMSKDHHHLHTTSHGSEMKSKSKDQVHKSLSGKSSKSKHQDDIMNLTPHDDNMQVAEDPFHNRADPPPNQFQPSYDQMTAPDPPTKAASSMSHNQNQQYNHNQNQYPDEPIIDHQMNEQESAIASGIALPLKELEYDDRVDYAADVSVMESLGGPSLLVERARHENAIQAGQNHASHENNLDRQDPELAELVAAHGEGFVPDPGMTREETAFRDPYKFYEHAVCALLRENEPEKVRLLSKLMAKYRGRERHLINKLSARYSKDKAHGSQDYGNVGGSGGMSGGNDEPVAQRSSSDIGRKGSADNNNNTNLGNKTSMSGMEKIHEHGEDEEAESSVLNDPSRANIAAIETAKKKLETSNSEAAAHVAASSKGAAAAKAQDEDIPKNKSSNDDGWPSSNGDGWPPAMSDPWGTGGAGASGDHQVTNNIPSVKDEEASRPMTDEGSYSDGSYSSAESDGVDGTSPAIIAQVSELLNYVYGKTSVAGQIDRVSTIMRAYEGREAVLLELLETKALIKANADSNRDASDLPVSLRNSPGLNNPNAKPVGADNGGNGDGIANANASSNLVEKKITPQTPISVLTAPTMADYAAGQASPASLTSAKEGGISPSATTLNTTASKKKKKGIFGGFFGGKKKDKKGNFPSSNETMSSPSKNNKSRKMGKKGQPLNEDDRSI